MAGSIFPEELDCFVESLRPFQVVDIGSDGWLQQNQTVVKLAQQAYFEANGKHEEIIKERILVEGKLTILVHEIHCVSVWKSKILIKLLEEPELSASFMIYSVFYYELNNLALLELILYHKASFEMLGDCLLDLIDYCALAIGQLIGLVNERRSCEKSENLDTETTKEELQRMREDIGFKIGLKCLSIFSYLTQNLQTLPLSASTRITKVHDLPCLAVEMLHLKPWLRNNKGTEKFVNDRWIPHCGDEIFKLAPSEAQTWICLYNLLLSSETMQHYEFSEYRKREISKCIALLNEQMQNVSDSKRGTGLFLEEIPELKTNLINNAKQYGISRIVQNHKTIFVTLTQEQIFEKAKRLNDIYNTEVLEEFDNSFVPPTNFDEMCQKCKAIATKKCSKCLKVRYCSRECQVSDWPQHKEQCHQIK
ncbi:zinc finger MYND domain-containing protein 10 homolog isoform X2 [Uranotaenia lowii]|uniref:zinc finger MYND domain-containing protein 10 homolog isoform X2 n=1 Tax=Uranotaenia lowii TaxID=190385 RepID=UPI0024797906|nr:zinc finger MYND domain-containing protein 10 homolog isoform X2 [Uranotaenia lowii]